MKNYLFFIICCALAALAPLAPARAVATKSERVFSGWPGWPTQFEGRPLVALPLTEREQRFATDFPGRIARFSDGRREIIVRWVTRETRALHPATDCFKAIGYRIDPLPLRIDEAGARWSGFEATRGDERLQVYERVMAAGNNDGWSDVSTWYWKALFGQTTGPWWALTIAERRQ